MIKNKYVEFTSLLIAVILTRVTDLIGTYYYTPDLAKEANSLVLLFGYGWIHLFVIQIIGIALIGIINYVSLYKTKVTIIESKELTFNEFLSMLYLNKVAAWK